MKRFVTICVLVFVVCQFSTVTGRSPEYPSSVTVDDLRCEYLVDPLGIDVLKPRLSWKLNAVNPDKWGQRQRTYHILVAGSKKYIEQNLGDIWNSGNVDSDQSVHVVYNGKPLKSQMECYWKVRVRDERGILSPWSKPARWTMGLLEKEDWTAKWIGSDQIFTRREGWPPPDNDVADPWFRKTFTLKGKPEKAVIHVASIGYHELYVNGEKVSEDVLSPSVANLRKRARYVTYEIADQLKPGKNVIGLWLGMSWSIFPPYKTEDKPQTAMVIAQAQIVGKDGESVQIITDQTWKTHPSPNTLLGVWDFMHFGGEQYDANKEVKGWCRVDLNDSKWKKATVYSPKVQLSAETIEPNRIIKKITPKKIDRVKEGVWRVDLGVNMVGYFEMDVTAKPGDAINFKFSEHQEKDMTHRLYSRYIVGPKGKGTFCNRFNYFSGRWVQVEGLKTKPSLDDIRVFMIRTDYERAGRFMCSNKLLNDIYETTLWTYENLSLGGYVVDCPQRERMGYGGDGHATTEMGLDNYSLGAFYTKWAQDWRDVQGRKSIWGVGDDDAKNDEKKIDDGNLPYTAPTFWGGGGPAWSGFCITLPWEIYEQYGDVRVLEENFDTMKRWLGFLETKAKDDMLVRWGGEWDFLGDWLWPGAEGVNGDTKETLFFNNCYWVYNLQMAAKIAEVLEHEDIAKKYADRADQVRRAVHKEFFNAAENGYVDNMQAYLSVALLVDLPPREIRAKVWKRLEDEILVHRKGHIWGGITGGYFITKNLLESDRPDLMFEMVSKDTYPGWGDMLGKGATTIWESWEGEKSLLHSSYLYVGAWYIEGLAGIKVGEKAGFKEFVIKPGLPDKQELDWVRAEYESNYGTIRSEWKRQGDKISMKITVPPNTSAMVYFPPVDKNSVEEGGKSPDSVDGISWSDENDSQPALRVLAGEYVFTAKMITDK